MLVTQDLGGRLPSVEGQAGIYTETLSKNMKIHTVEVMTLVAEGPADVSSTPQAVFHSCDLSTLVLFVLQI